MKRATVFQNGGSQAVRIPKQFNLTALHVLIEQDGNRIIITPLPERKSWLAFADSAPLPSDDFMVERTQLPNSARNWD